MKYVNPEDVLNRFIRYINEYDSELLSRDVVIEELQDALEDANYEEIEQ